MKCPLCNIELVQINEYEYGSLFIPEAECPKCGYNNLRETEYEYEGEKV